MPPIPAKTPAAPMPVAPSAGQPSLTFLQDPALNQGVKDQICALTRRFPLDRVIEKIETNYHCKVSREQILAVWAERYAPEMQAAPAPDEGRPDKESVHPADALQECLLTPSDTSPEPALPPAIATDAPPTRTGPGQEKDAMRIPPVQAKDTATQRMTPSDPPEPIVEAAPANPRDETGRALVVAGESDPDLSPTGPSPTETSSTKVEVGQEEESVVAMTHEVREFIIERMARRDPPWLIAQAVETKFRFVVDDDEIIVCWRDRDTSATRTGPGQEKESMPKLNDEIKEFIVKRIACYETPSRIAAAVRNDFGIDIDRRRVFDYNPAGSRPPAQRWIDLHAATRAQFLRDTAEIGVAQKVIRLKMLDRFAQLAEDNNRHDKAAKYLEQAARECGGFYEKRRAPSAARGVATD